MQNCKKNAEKSEKKWSDRICWGLVGKKAGCGSVENNRPEAETRAEDDLELDYKRNKKKKSRACYDSFFVACKSGIL